METGITSQIATSDYLTLLTIQLQNQDPVDPIKQEDFISQLSQFSVLEGVEGLNASFENMLQLQEVSQGLDLVGKSIEYVDVQTGELREGIVSEFFVDGGEIKLMVNDQSITVDLISSVRN